MRLARALGALAALALLVAAVVLGRAGQGGPEASVASAANLGPRGLAAAVELLRSTGAAVTRRGPGEPGSGAAVVLVIAPGAQLADEDVSSLLAQADRGGTVVIALGRAPQPALAAALGVERIPASAAGEAHGLAPHRLVADLSLPGWSDALRSTRPGGLAVSGDRGWTAAASVPVGRGEVLVLAGPGPLENAHLAEADAASLVVRLGALGPVELDERFLSAPSPPASRSRRALLLASAQLLLAGAALVVARGRRLGAVRPPPADAAHRTARDYLASLAALYRRAGAEEEVAAQAWRGLRRRIERRWGVPARVPDLQAARRLEARSPQAALALARGSAALADGGPGVLLGVMRAAADAERALEGRR